MSFLRSSSLQFCGRASFDILSTSKWIEEKTESRDVWEIDPVSRTEFMGWREERGFWSHPVGVQIPVIPERRGRKLGNGKNSTCSAPLSGERGRMCPDRAGHSRLARPPQVSSRSNADLIHFAQAWSCCHQSSSFVRTSLHKPGEEEPWNEKLLSVEDFATCVLVTG